jgi:hypothetical protein
MKFRLEITHGEKYSNQLAPTQHGRVSALAGC